MITYLNLTCSDYLFAISSDVGIQMKLILRKIQKLWRMSYEIDDTLKGSDDSKDQTKCNLFLHHFQNSWTYSTTTYNPFLYQFQNSWTHHILTDILFSLCIKLDSEENISVNKSHLDLLRPNLLKSLSLNLMLRDQLWYVLIHGDVSINSVRLKDFASSFSTTLC